MSVQYYLTFSFMFGLHHLLREISVSSAAKSSTMFQRCALESLGLGLKLTLRRLHFSGRLNTHSGEVLVLSSDPEGPVGASVSEDHALRDRVAVDKSFVSLPLKARRVPALLHHVDGHLRHRELIPVGHL